MAQEIQTQTSAQEGYFFDFPTRQLKSKLRPWVIAACLALFAVLVIIPPPQGLSDQGMNAIAIFVLCLLFWVSNAVPLMVTSLMAIILMPLLGVLDTKTAYALFGNQAVFFILGAFILASAVMQSGLSTRIALKVLTRFKHSHRALLIGMLLLPAGLSYIMSEHAVAAMLFPIVLEISAALRLKKGSTYGTALFLALAWGCVIGGIGSFLGGARAILAVGILEESTTYTVTFMEWVYAALPLVVVMLAVAAAMLLVFTRKTTFSITDASERLQSRISELGPVTNREKAIGVLMIVTVLLWIFAGTSIGLANIALGAVVVAFIFKLLSWKQVEHDVNWGIILMYGGAIAVGYALSETGAALWAAQQILNSWTVAAFTLLVFFAIIAIFFTEGISNAAVVTMLVPIAIGVSTEYGIDPRIATLAIAIPCGLAFMLPMSTPAIAISHSSGYVSTSHTIRFGLFLNIIAIISFVMLMKWYWPLIGLSL